VKARLPIDIDDIDCDVDQMTAEESRHERVKHLAESLVATRKTAAENIQSAQTKQIQRFDLKREAPTYQVGNKVLRYNRRCDTRMGDKLQQQFTGPFVVAEVLGHSVFRLHKDGVVMS